MQILLLPILATPAILLPGYRALCHAMEVATGLVEDMALRSVGNDDLNPN